MRLIVGLGNPGGRYALTRHNIGFIAVDAMARRHRFAAFRAKFSGELSEGTLGDARVYALKPQTFMNLSGDSVGAAARFYKIAPEEIAVIHDEIDLRPGKLRVKRGGGNAGRARDRRGRRRRRRHGGRTGGRVGIRRRGRRPPAQTG